MKQRRKALYGLILLFFFLISRDSACALDKIKPGQLVLFGGYFQPKESTLSSGGSAGLKYIPVDKKGAQLSAGVILSFLTLKTTSTSIQHRDYFLNYTMRVSPSSPKRTLIPHAGIGIDYVDLPNAANLSPQESAGFNVHAGVHYGDHFAIEARYLFSKKANFHRGGWGIGAGYRF